MAKKKSASSNGGGTFIQIPGLRQDTALLRLVGDSPLLVNNKFSVAWRIAKRYQGAGKTKRVKVDDLSLAEQYEDAFYVLPSSPEPQPSEDGLYGVPASGVKKCIQKGIRPAGFTDNTTIGLIGKSFRVHHDEGGLCLVRHNGFVQDSRPVNIGSGQKTVPNIRYRPLFHEWEIWVRVTFNSNILSFEQLGNLAMHAGQYIGLCEMRAEKMQGECGGFVVGSFEDTPDWASNKRWKVKADAKGFRVLAKR